MNARVERKGAKVTGEAFYGINDPPPVPILHARITCVSIDGNAAALGGLIESTNPPQAWFIFVRDNGPAGGPVRDESTPSFVGALDDPANPPGFPSVCPAPDDTTINTTGFLPLHSGDIVVHEEADD